MAAAAALVAAFALTPPTADGADGNDPDCDLPGAVQVPNGYDKEFCVADDQLFIFAANYKPFEYGFDENRQATTVFNEVIGNKLQAAFPDVDVKYATWDMPVRYSELEAAGVVPDIVLDNPASRIDRNLEPMGWVQDLTDEVTEAGIALDQLNPAAVEMVKSRSDGGLYGVPVFIDDHVLYYNKKIFDKFGVKYPQAGWTYDDAYKAAKKLTQEVGTDAYKGYMQHPGTYLQLNQLGAYPFQPTGSEEPAPEDIVVDITTEEYKRLGENLDRFLMIPRNRFTTVDDIVKGDMSRPGHVAMAVDTLQKLPKYKGSKLFTDDGDEADWAEWIQAADLGIAPVPVLSRGSQTTYQPNTTAAFVTPQSPQQDLAMQVVKWLTSEEAQVELSSHALKGVLETEAVVNSFGDAIPELEGVDTTAVYWGENASVQNYQNTEFWDIPMYMVFRQHVLTDGMSFSSALQVTQEEDVPAYIARKAESGEGW